MNILNKLQFIYHRLMMTNNIYNDSFYNSDYVYFVTCDDSLITNNDSVFLKPRKTSHFIDDVTHIPSLYFAWYMKKTYICLTDWQCLEYVSPTSLAKYGDKLFVLKSKNKVRYYNPNYLLSKEKWLLDKTEFEVEAILNEEGLNQVINVRNATLKSRIEFENRKQEYIKNVLDIQQAKDLINCFDIEEQQNSLINQMIYISILNNSKNIEFKKGVVK